MSLTFGQHALRFGRSMLSWSNRLVRFVKHRMLTQKKNILIIGDQQSKIYGSLYPLIANHWEIVHVEDAAEPLGVEEQVNAIREDVKEVKEGKKDEMTGEEKTDIVKKEEAKSKSTKSFQRLYLHGQNYHEIEGLLQGKQFDSIIVLPTEDHKTPSFNIQDETFLTEYPKLHNQLFLRNMFAYRLASKCLTSSGVIILSISQRDFVKEYQTDNQSSTAKKYHFSNELIDAQINYLGVAIGDRDYTDLNSWSIVAMSKELAEQDANFVSKYYKIWADSQQLPMPGSFALFKRKTPTTKTHYVQYL